MKFIEFSASLEFTKPDVDIVINTANILYCYPQTREDGVLFINMIGKTITVDFGHRESRQQFLYKLERRAKK